ncbi:MAG: phosphoribosyltransferase family protein [Patescibacteria group bacterium]|nr:phosphoribosyltransferase family protein [Patescibacteria group bacterium]
MDKEKIIAAIFSANNVYIDPSNPIRGGAGLYQAIYLDHRNLFSFVAERNLIIEALKEKIVAEQQFDFLAGKETGGIAPTAMMSHDLNIPMVYIRKKPKNGGRLKQVEGEFKPGDKGVIIDDTIVTGGNICRATEAALAVGAQVVGAASISIINTDLFAKQFEKLNLRLTYLVTMSEIVAWGIANKKIAPEYINEINEYLADPLGWGIKNGFDVMS